MHGIICNKCVGSGNYTISFSGVTVCTRDGTTVSTSLLGTSFTFVEGGLSTILSSKSGQTIDLVVGA